MSWHNTHEDDDKFCYYRKMTTMYSYEDCQNFMMTCINKIETVNTYTPIATTLTKFLGCVYFVCGCSICKSITSSFPLSSAIGQHSWPDPYSYIIVSTKHSKYNHLLLETFAQWRWFTSLTRAGDFTIMFGDAKANSSVFRLLEEACIHLCKISFTSRQAQHTHKKPPSSQLHERFIINTMLWG